MHQVSSINVTFVTLSSILLAGDSIQVQPPQLVQRPPHSKELSNPKSHNLSGLIMASAQNIAGYSALLDKEKSTAALRKNFPKDNLRKHW